MKMYKITPAKRTIETIEYNGDYSGMRPYIKYEWFDHARMNDKGDRVFVNDTGLIDGTEEVDGVFWYLHDNGVWQKFVGDALYWGTRGEDNADPSLTIEELRVRVCYERPKGWTEPDHTPQVVSFNNVEELLDYMLNKNQ